MKILDTIKEHVEDKVIVKEVLCDLCGSDVDESSNGCDCNRIIIEATIGSVYPEHDARTLYITDICAICFLDKIMPTLEGIGVKFREIGNEERYQLHE